LEELGAAEKSGGSFCVFEEDILSGGLACYMLKCLVAA
jgi:hypothetical protein